MSKHGIPDEYELKARWAPAALCSVPFLIFYHYWLELYFKDFFEQIAALRFAGYAIMGLAAMYLLIQLNSRFFGRLLQGWLFDEGKKIPTTEFLTPESHELSRSTKRDIAKKFKSDFGLTMPLGPQNMSDSEYRFRVYELIAYIKRSLETDRHVKRHNIEYGFVRNLCGGCIGATFFSLFDVLFFGLLSYSSSALALSIISVVVYFVIALLSGRLIRHYGKAYARILFERYLTNRSA